MKDTQHECIDSYTARVVAVRHTKDKLGPLIAVVSVLLIFFKDGIGTPSTFCVAAHLGYKNCSVERNFGAVHGTLLAIFIFVFNTKESCRIGYLTSLFSESTFLHRVMRMGSYVIALYLIAEYLVQVQFKGVLYQTPKVKGECCTITIYLMS